MNSNTTNNVFKYIIIGGLFIIPFFPLIVANSLYFPFITGKAFFFRIVVEIIFAAWIILMFKDKSYRPKWSWMLGVVSIFVFTTLISDLAGISTLRSLWSNFERMEGWITIVHLWAYFLVASSVLRNKKWWHYFFNVTLIVGLIISCYGLLQLAGKAEIHQGSTRIDASLGNAAYMGVYMLIHTFIAVYMAVGAWLSRKQIGWGYLFLAVLFGFIVFETATRGSILGLAVGLAAGLTIFAIKVRGDKKSRYIAVSILALMAVVVGIFYISRESMFVKNNEVLSRLASISIHDTTTQARAFIWPMAIRGTFESPKTVILGLGQENFNYIFNEKYNPKMWMHEQWFDRAHSVFLDWLVAGGLVGLGLYLTLFILSFVFIWKSALSLAEKCTLTGLLIAYAIHNVFVFDNLSSYVLFFSVLAFLHSIRVTDLHAKREIKWISNINVTGEVVNYAIAPVVVIALIFSLYFVNIRLINVNRAFITALQTCSPPMPDPKLFIRALSYRAYVAEQEIHEQILTCSSRVISSPVSSIDEVTKDNFLLLAKKAIADQIEITPYDARIYIIAGSFFNQIGLWSDARPFLEKARTLAPNKQAVMFELGTSYINLDMKKEGLELFKEAYESATEYDTAKLYYAVGLITAKKEKVFEELFGKDPLVTHDPHVINALISAKSYTRAIKLSEEYIKDNPKDISIRKMLAAMYIEVGSRTKAVNVLKEIQIIAPEFKDQIESLINDIYSGKNVLQ